MKIELESLAQKFATHRSTSKSKNIIYPLKLRKQAASLALAHPVKQLAKDLGVSVVTIKSWSKSFTPQVAEGDLVAVQIPRPAEPTSQLREDLKVKIIALEISLPSADLARTLADVIRGMGAQSC